MYYFLPSWYRKTSMAEHEPFSAVEERWYLNDRRCEFDDTVHQVRMFLASGESPVLLSLAYAPTLRHNLHRLGIDMMEVISAFDRMQNVTEKNAAVFSYRDLDWPEGIGFEYTPFCVVGYLEGKRFVRVEFGEEGNFLYADYYAQDGGVARCEVYDDRGFLSSVLEYENGMPVRRHYLDPAGNLRFSHALLSGTITVAEGARGGFNQESYASMEELLSEMIGRIVQEMTDEDLLVIASDRRHNHLFTDYARHVQMAFSYYGERFDPGNKQALAKDAACARFLVTDTEDNARHIRTLCGSGKPVYDLSPFDTRLSLGQSQRVREMKILLAMEHLDEPRRSSALKQILLYMQENRNTQLLLLARSGETYTEAMLQALTDQVMNANGIGPFTIAGMSAETSCIAENETGAVLPDEKRPRVMIHFYLTEHDLIRILRDVRLIVDVSDRPDLYLQIAGISAGIPQINSRFTRYVEHLRNGYIIGNIAHLSEGLSWYLSDLAHWNEALVYCVQQIARFEHGAIVEKWKEFLTRHG